MSWHRLHRLMMMISSVSHVQYLSHFIYPFSDKLLFLLLKVRGHGVCPSQCGTSSLLLFREGEGTALNPPTTTAAQNHTRQGDPDLESTVRPREELQVCSVRLLSGEILARPLDQWVICLCSVLKLQRSTLNKLKMSWPQNILIWKLLQSVIR